MPTLRQKVNFFQSRNGTTKLKPEELDYIEESWEKITGSDQALTFREYFIKLLEFSRNTPGGNSDVENQLREEVERLRVQLQETPAANDEELGDLRQQNIMLQNKLTELEAKKNIKVPVQLNEGEIIVSIPEWMDYFLVKIVEKEKQRTGRDVKKGDVLLHLFWAQISKGAGDHLPIVFRDSDISKILKQFKDARKQKKQEQKHDDEAGTETDHEHGTGGTIHPDIPGSGSGSDQI